MPVNLRQYTVNHFVHWLPATRLYRMKARLYRWTGLDVDPTVRLVSSVSIWGQMPLHIGKDTFIGHEVLITGATAPIHIGNDVDIAPRVNIISGTHEIDTSGARSAGRGISLPIVIEDGVWIGAATIIIGGVTVGRKSIIGAGSVVISSIPPFTLAVGNPCRPVKKWDDAAQQWIPITAHG
jgi:maltose O-acetyltransferase